MTPATVSVILPTRDRPAELAGALDAVAAQTQAPLEVIVVDDGSDPPVEVGPGVTLVRCDQPSGPGAARNRGAAEARGEVLAFLDDDDRWRPEFLEHQVAALADADAALSGWARWDDGVLLDTVLPPTDLPAVLRRDPVAVPSCFVVRSAAFTEIGGFDPGLRFGEDWDFALRLADDHRIATVPEVLVDREVHPHARYGRRLVTDHVELMRRLSPRLDGLDLATRRRHWVRLGQYLARVALEPLVVGRAPWRARHDARRRRAQRDR